MPAIAIARMLSITTGDGKTTPRWSRVRGPDTASDLEAEAAGGALALAGGAQPAQAADQQRVDLERLGTVDQGVEHLVVPRRRHVELLPDCGLLGAGVLPPLPFEVEDLAVAVAEARGLGVVAVEGVRGVHALSPRSGGVAVGPHCRRRTTSMSFARRES